uniref:Putative endonuclease domain protein n=1 Tax=Ixodes ricinus TaxID=34613 RepID=A0A147BK69_IXORI
MALLRFSFLFILGLHVLTLNVQGFRCPNKQREVIHFAQSQHCDLLFLQETNFFSAQHVIEFKARFSIPCYFSLASSRSCGVGVLIFRSSLLRGAFSVCDPDGRVLVYQFFVGNAKFRAISVYAPTRPSASHPFFKSLLQCVPPDGFFFVATSIAFLFLTAMFAPWPWAWHLESS